MVSNTTWLQGPEFFWKDEILWPTTPTLNHSSLEDDKEVKKRTVSHAVKAEEVSEAFDSLLERYSSW